MEVSGACSGIDVFPPAGMSVAPTVGVRDNGLRDKRVDPPHTHGRQELRSEDTATRQARPRLKTSCLINNYNYAHFVGDAVDSALAQTVGFDEIIVVDDGSTDGSAELLTRRYGTSDRVRIIRKPNGGQLSSFNEGFLASSGDLLFFLDADDIYQPAYVETTLQLYEQRPELDFVFCAPRLFGNEEREEYRYPADTDFGYSMVLTYFDMQWIGNPTSCISARRELLARFMPLPNTRDWRLRADDCLVFGASLAGGRKYFFHRCLARYRVHGKNGFFGKGLEAAPDYPRALALERLRGVLCHRLGLTADAVARQIADEFRTIPEPRWRQLRQYSRMARRWTPNRAARQQMLAEIVAHFRENSPEMKNWLGKLRLSATHMRWHYGR
jgi:glycosyltransferase involved in cell wall biosynthesis